MKTETLYRKVQHGKRARYFPATVHIDDLHTFPEGWHLIHIRHNGGSYHYNVDPDRAAVLAAIRSMTEPMVQAMSEANRYTPERTPNTPEEQKVLEEYLRLRGDTLTVFRGVSMYDVVEAGIRALEDNI